MSFGWGTKWTLWKNPISFTLHPLEFCLLRYHDGLQNQRSRQNDGGHPKQNPANNYGNRFSSSWSRQNKFDRGKPIKPPTCYFSRKAGQLISRSPEKWRVAPKRDGFLVKTFQRQWEKSTNIRGRCTTSRWPLLEAQSELHGKTPWASHFTR